MPKERTHWHLARRAATQLASGPLADAVLAYPEDLLVGAVSHDTGYYALGDQAARAAADRAHGAAGADSYQRFRALWSRRQDLGPAGLAFGFGALTHLAADVVFHPLVFSWTGSADAPDEALRRGWLYRHQALETALDVHMEALWGPAPARYYGPLVQKAGPAVTSLVDTFLGAPSRRWMGAHRRFQGLFHHGWARAAVKLWAWRHPRGDGDWSGAFYGLIPGRQKAFEGTLGWVDPVTGKDGEATLAALVGRFDTLIQDLGQAWERSWTSASVPFEGQVGPDLDTGLRSDRPSIKRHFRPLAGL